MDLAAIRKKAKGADIPPLLPEKKEIAATPSAPEHFAEVLTTRAEGMRELSPAVETPTSVLDPLEALFSGSLEDGGITGENYLQTLNRSVEESESLRKLLTFFLADEEYALDIEVIREIIKPREVTDLPRVPDFILGLISLRGIIIPIFDLKRRLKLGNAEITPASRVIICQHEDKMIGLLVDSITQVICVPEKCIEPPPAVLSGLDRDLVEGVGRFQGKMMILLHLPCVADAELV
jgi:purine-binding chemotaxis protein CheW